MRFAGERSDQGRPDEREGRRAAQALSPSKAGIMLVKITSAKACNSARIGVVGVFEPPVTG